MNQKIICTACGTQFPNIELAPERCPICNDDRQYVPENVQTWTTLNDLSRNYSVTIQTTITDHLYGLKMEPSFAIGQRALLVLAPGGNLLWDCIPLLDRPTIDFIESKGGLKAIAISHPHFYSTMNDWADVFNCPIYIHQADEQWLVNKGVRVSLWPGTEKELWDGIRLIKVGGHFPGSSILHVPFLSPEGVVLCGDSFVISPSKRHIAVMHSYPNRIPLPLDEIQRIRVQMRPLRFDTIHAWDDSQSICSDAKLMLENSLARYVQSGSADASCTIITEAFPHLAKPAKELIELESRSRKQTFIVIYKPGPSRLAGQPLSEQPLKEHGQYLLKLYQTGILRFAGPFNDDQGGAAVIEVGEESEAQSIANQDPAVINRLFVYELHPWRLVPWEQYSK